MAVTSLELSRIAATAADDKKATDIILIDLTEASDVCDYFLIATANNRPQLDAVVEGKARSSWVLLDYGTLVCHIFLPETRDFYRLERLWGDAPRVKLGLEGEAPSEAE